MIIFPFLYQLYFPKPNNPLIFLFCLVFCTYCIFFPVGSDTCIKCLSVIFSKCLIHLKIHQSHFLLEPSMLETSISFSNWMLFWHLSPPVRWSALCISLLWSKESPLTWYWVSSGDYFLLLSRMGKDTADRKLKSRLHGIGWPQWQPEWFASASTRVTEEGLEELWRALRGVLLVFHISCNIWNPFRLVYDVFLWFCTLKFFFESKIMTLIGILNKTCKVSKVL